MKIFVTGGAGFIGSNFITHVLGLSQDYSVVNYDKLTYAGNLANLDSIADDPQYSFIKGDICDPAAVEAAMAGCQTVVHFAAESHVDRSIYEPAPVIETNVTGTFVLLQIARKLNIEEVRARFHRRGLRRPAARHIRRRKLAGCSQAARTPRRKQART